MLIYAAAFLYMLVLHTDWCEMRIVYAKRYVFIALLRTFNLSSNLSTVLAENLLKTFSRSSVRACVGVHLHFRKLPMWTSVRISFIKLYALLATPVMRSANADRKTSSARGWISRNCLRRACAHLDYFQICQLEEQTIRVVRRGFIRGLESSLTST